MTLYVQELLMNIAIKSALNDWEKFVQGFGFGQRCVKSIIECDQRQTIVSECDTQTLKHG